MNNRGDAWTNANIDYARERRLWKRSEKNQWLVAQTAYKCPNRTERLKLAGACECSEDTVSNLASAYMLFSLLVVNNWQSGKSSEPVRNLRRRFPYTRWMTVYKMWVQHEFPLEEAMDWLENFDGGNDAMAAEITNKHGAPEWERRANEMYRGMGKLSTDLGAPAPLQRAAKYYMKVFDKVFPKVTL